MDTGNNVIINPLSCPLPIWLSNINLSVPSKYITALGCILWFRRVTQLCHCRVDNWHYVLVWYMILSTCVIYISCVNAVYLEFATQIISLDWFRAHAYRDGSYRVKSMGVLIYDCARYMVHIDWNWFIYYLYFHTKPNMIFLKSIFIVFSSVLITVCAYWDSTAKNK